MPRSMRRPLLVAAVLLLAGFSVPPSCVIPSDARLFADDDTLVDLPELDGRFLYEGEIPFEIFRLGGGQYEYVGPVLALLDPDRVTAAEIEALGARYGAFGLPKPETSSLGRPVRPPALEPHFRELEVLCPAPAWYDGRRCARLLAELLEPDYPGVVAFEQAVAALPSLHFRERARFSLHQLGSGRLAGQSEEALEELFRPALEVEERLGGMFTAWRFYSWADELRGYSEDEHEDEVFWFEIVTRPYGLVPLQQRDDGSFVIHPVEACMGQEEQLSAFGFTVRQRDEADAWDLESIVAGPDADIVGLLNACFPEDPSEGFRFWKIDAPPPAPAAPAG
jgi:hypothetical protein